jgi:RimJ/RimL family protein N-acetyltransferase
MERTKSKLPIDFILIIGGWGLATEAARAVWDHAFPDLKLPQVISLIHPDNKASRRVAEKNGMKGEKKRVFRGFPTLVFAINRDQWQTKRAAG